MARHTRRGNVIHVKFDQIPPGASAEVRANVYGNALLATENALNEMKDEIARHTEELIVRQNLQEKKEEENDRRFGHIEAMLEVVLRALSIDPATLRPIVPPVRDKLPTADDIEIAVERGFERAIERDVQRKTPVTAFQVPGFNPWQAPPEARGLTSERVKELVETTTVEGQARKLVADAEKRAEMYRNIIVGAVGTVGGAGLLGLGYVIAKTIVAAHGP
jgi:hypothetical protein